MVKGRRRVVIARVVALVLCWAGLVHAVTPGEAFPAVQAPRLDGQGLAQVADWQGRVVYVDVWASWCPPCRLSLPVLESWRQDYAARGFEVLGLTVDSDLNAARAALQRAGASYPVLHSIADAELRTLGIQTMPTAYLLDRAGVVRVVHRGFHQRDVAGLRAQIEALLQEAP